MAVVLSNIKSKACLKKLDEYLLTHNCINDYMRHMLACLQLPGSTYVIAHTLLNHFPHVARWNDRISALLRPRVTAEGEGVKVESSACHVASTSEVADQKAPADDEEDGDYVVLSGEETKEENKSAEECTAPIKASTNKKKWKLIQWLLEWDPLMLCLLLAGALTGSYNHFKVSCHDRYKPWHKVAINLIEFFIGVLCVNVEFHKLVVISPFPRIVQIFRETYVIVILSYVLLVDINLNYLWLVIFPGITILFIDGLSDVLGGRGRVNSGSSSSAGGCTESEDEKAIRTPVGLTLMVMMPFFTLSGMGQLPDHAADRFAISQFLLFLSTTLAALTRMMRMVSAGMPPRIAQASELLYKISLLVLLVTAHTVAAELLGEAVVLTCMPEVAPVLLWFSLHLDRKPGSSSIITVDKMRPHRKVLIALGAVVAGLLAYLASSMDESGFSSWCTTIMVSCGVSGILTYYLVFMLRQWPGQQADKEEVVQAEKIHAGNGKGIVQAAKGKRIEKVVQSQKQSNSIEEAVQLLNFWASCLLIAACVLALLLLSIWWVLPKFPNSYSLPCSKKKNLLPPVTLTSMPIF